LIVAFTQLFIELVILKLTSKNIAFDMGYKMHINPLPTGMEFLIEGISDYKVIRGLVIELVKSKFSKLFMTIASHKKKYCQVGLLYQIVVTVISESLGIYVSSSSPQNTFNTPVKHFSMLL